MPTWIRIQNLRIMRWTIIKEEQLTKINLGFEKNLQHVKINVDLESIISNQLIELLRNSKTFLPRLTKIWKGYHLMLLNIRLSWTHRYHFLIKQGTS
jgi:hypothetical protein